MTEITTPTGRIVWGHPLKSRPKTDNQNKPVMKDGVQVMQWSFGLAIPKLEFNPIWAVMHAEASKSFPAGVFPHDYAWKMVDGDSMDKGNPARGIPPKPYSDREGYAGCYVLAISTELFAPPVYKWNGSGYTQLTESEFKCGDYAQVNLDIQAHLGQSPGLYLNPRGINLVGHGTPIISGGIDPTAAFGAGPVALPPGATATPQAPAGAPAMPGTGMPPAPGAPAGAPPLPGAPTPTPQAPIAPAAVPPAPTPAAIQPAPGMPIVSPSNGGTPPLPGMPAAPIQPAHDFVANAAGQTPPAAPGAPARQPVAYDPNTGAAIYGYNPANGQPLYQ